MRIITTYDDLIAILNSDQSYWFAFGSDYASYIIIHSGGTWSLLNFSHIDYKQFSGDISKSLPLNHVYYVYNMELCPFMRHLNSHDMATCEWYICNDDKYSEVLKTRVWDIVRRYPDVENIHDIIHVTAIVAEVKRSGMNILRIIDDIGRVYPKHGTYTHTYYWSLIYLSTSGLGIIENGQLKSPRLEVLGRTRVGRPTIKYSGKSLTSLRKDNGDRDMLVPTRGVFVDFDYVACHVYIIANAIEYSFGGDDPYHHFAKQYHQTDIITDNMYANMKKQTFKALYGDWAGDNKMGDLPFFSKTKTLSYLLHEANIADGYIETPYGRKILLSDESPGKLLSYYLLSVETEKNLTTLDRLQKYFQNKVGKVVLYTYDSYLIDMPEYEMQYIPEIRLIIEEGGFPCKIRTGTTFANLNSFN